MNSRRRIAHRKAQDYADFKVGLQQGFVTDEMGFRGQLARQQTLAVRVRFGSKAEIARDQPNVRFAPKSGHGSVGV